MNKAALDLSTCLDREEAPQLHGGTMLSLAMPSGVGLMQKKLFCFLPKKTSACSGTNSDLGSSGSASPQVLESEKQKVGTWQMLLLRLHCSLPKETQIGDERMGTETSG